MGSEMCIRDSGRSASIDHGLPGIRVDGVVDADQPGCETCKVASCLLYTSDAADERSSVDLGGRRIIKKKKNKR